MCDVAYDMWLREALAEVEPFAANVDTESGGSWVSRVREAFDESLTGTGGGASTQVQRFIDDVMGGG